MEKLVHSQLHGYLFTNGLIYKRQSAYSTTCNLISLVHLIHENLDKCNEVRTVFLDISKAFDKPLHQGLLYKLHQFGIEGSFLKWIDCYLLDRSQRVVISGQSSSIQRLFCGVSQGSILVAELFRP